MTPVHRASSEPEEPAMPARERTSRRLPWRRFSDLTPAEREHRLSTLAGISYVLMAIPFLIVYVLVVLAVLDA